MMSKVTLKWFNNMKEKEESEYVTLTPNDNILNGAEYLNALKWAIDNKRAKNIALSGPYGSGKSSIIETFLKNNPDLKKRSLKISMATFVEQTISEDGTIENQKIEFEKNEIEKEILKQLFYKVDQRKIPQSRYRKLHKVRLGRIFSFTFLLAIVCFVIGCIFWPSIIVATINKVFVAGAMIKLSKAFSLVLFCLLTLICLALISVAYKVFLSKLRIKEIKLPADISIQGGNENHENVFDGNIDEIIYFFEETKYNIVFFEDFDRLNNTSIFVNLRDLNIILNNYEAIKDPIIFVYAVRDDIFTPTDRTKFFDFIIPVVPIINSTNSGEILVQKLNTSRELSKIHNISESFILDVAPFISDMRILQNIYNEFVIYKTTLTTEQELKLLDEPMLALIIFKNLYPYDFAELQMEKGIVKQAFNDKNNFISQERVKIQKRIELSTKILDNISAEFFSSIKALKCAFISEITGYLGIAKQFTPDEQNTVYTTSFMQDNYRIPDWSNITNCSGYYIRWDCNSVFNFSCLNFDKIYSKFINNYKAVELIQNDKVEEEKTAVETLKNQSHKLSSKSLAELIEIYGAHSVLSSRITANSLLSFFLRRGYIDEKYVDYINYFKATTITTDDMNYILGIKNLSPKPYNYKLTRADLVINRLQPYEFEQEEIYNFDLLECLLGSNKYNEKLNLYIKQLSNGSENSWKFINEFIDITEQKQHFIGILAEVWRNMWDSISNNSILTLERKFFYLTLLISSASIESIESMDTNGKLSEFFVSNTDIFKHLSSVDDQKIIDVITTLKIKFTDIQIEAVSSRILDYIFDNNFYDINLKTIQQIVEYKSKDFVSSLRTKNYSTLLKLNYVPLLKHIENNIDTYIDNVILDSANTEEDIEAIIKLLELDTGSKCRYDQIIKNENFFVDDITKICSYMWKDNKEYVSSIWNSIIVNEKLKPSWHNFNSYWRYLGHTSISIAYMCKNADALKMDNSTCINDKRFIKEFIESDIEQTYFAKLLPKLPWSNFDIQLNTLDEDKVSIMISQRYFGFTVERYNELLEAFPELSFEFIILNQSEYMSVKDQIYINSNFLELLVFDERFNRTYAQCLVDEYGTRYMTIKMAKSLKSMGIKLNINLFNTAWELLDSKGKENLMLENLNLLDANMFENCFSELEEPYRGLSYRAKRHTVFLPDNQKNRKLAQRLYDIEYITSFQKKPVKTLKSIKSEIVCRVKVAS